MQTKSKIESQCPKCPEIIKIGDSISILLGEWMHTECKAASLAAKQYTVTEVPQRVPVHVTTQFTQRRIKAKQPAHAIRRVTGR